MLLCSDGVLHSVHELIAWNAFCSDDDDDDDDGHHDDDHEGFLNSKYTVVWGPSRYHSSKMTLI